MAGLAVKPHSAATPNAASRPLLARHSVEGGHPGRVPQRGGPRAADRRAGSVRHLRRAYRPDRRPRWP